MTATSEEIATPIHVEIDPATDDRLRQSAELLLAARRERAPIPELPLKLRPATLAEAYHLQGILTAALGEIGGWKVGAPAADAVPVRSPMPLWGGYARSGATLAATFSRWRGVEAEIAFLLGADLPARELPYSREEVLAAIAGAHPAIEILESAFDDPDKVDRLSIIGDLQSNGGFAYGDSVPNWRELDLTREQATMIVDGVVRVEATGSNPGGTDLMRLVTWLVNDRREHHDGLKAGDWITTGSWTGKMLASPGSEVVARFSNFGEVQILFAAG
jgi:2-keto-4-pentenoate hydratase